MGGGLSGVLVAEHLAAEGLSCLILEAGPVLERKIPGCNLRRYKEVTAPLLAVDEAAWGYRTQGPSYEWIRVRAGGGRSLVWGGWALRPDEQSLRDAAAQGDPWPISLDDLHTHIRRVERLLGVREANLEPHFLALRDKLGLEAVPKRVAAGPCGCRPFVSLDWRRRARLRPDSVALRILVEPGRGATGVEYVDAPSGQRGVARAKVVVLCASPIETARLLLSSLDGQTEAVAHVGKNLVDHVVASALVLAPEPAAHPEPVGPFERVAFVPRFVNLGRRRRRDYRGGFSLELHGPNPLSELDPESLGALEVDPKGASELSYYLVHAIGEAFARPDRYVELHPSERDSLGRPLPLIHLAWGDNEQRMTRDMCETVIAVADALAPPGSRIFPLGETLRSGTITHEASTCRMGRSARRSVTDLSGRVHGVPGLYVADASLMPTGLDRPPTLTVLALALNTADAIRERASYSSSSLR